MAVRVGFTKFRQQTMEKELVRILEVLPQLGVEKVILFGDLAEDKVGPESTLELIMVQDIPGAFNRRMDYFISHLHPEVATNYWVYTPAEFYTLQETNTFLAQAVKKGKVVYE